MRRSEILWLLPVALLLLLAVWWIPGASSVNTDSYSVAYAGKKVLYRSLRRLDPSVSRSVDQLIPNPGGGDRLLFLGPARYPSADEWDEIHNAVLNGTSVVFAASIREPNLEAGPFGLRVVSNSDGLSDPDGDVPTGSNAQQPVAEADAEPEADATETNQEDIEVDFAPWQESGSLAETELVEEAVTWRSSGHIVMDSGRWAVLVSARSKPQVVYNRFGLGSFTLVASDEIFCNGAMLKPKRALLAYRILELAQTDGDTRFDEVLSSTGVPKVLGILFAPEFRPLTLQLLLIAVLFGWLGSRRFGAVTRSTHSRRRSIVEHAEAVGILYFRSNAGRHAVQLLHEFLRQELRRLCGSSFRVGSAQAVARQAQMDEEHVQELFERIRAAEHTRLTGPEAARILKQLSKLVSAIRRDSQS